jgi:hypothetical protein
MQHDAIGWAESVLTKAFWRIMTTTFLQNLWVIHVDTVTGDLQRLEVMG